MWIVDRLEGDWVICEKEDGEMESVPLERFSGPVQEGDCLREQDGLFFADPEATQARRAQMKKRFSKFFR